jgi:hypothetical protein
MSLVDDLLAAVTALAGQTFAPALPVTATDPQQTMIELSVLAAEPLAVSLEQIRLVAPHLQQSNLDSLKRWANALCQRVTYLLENLGPLEFDSEGQQVLIRSTAPNRRSGQARYYEILLSTPGPGQFLLRRYEAASAGGGRNWVPIQLTHELLVQLLSDLMDTLPASP